MAIVCGLQTRDGDQLSSYVFLAVRGRLSGLPEPPDPPSSYRGACNRPSVMRPRTVHRTEGMKHRAKTAHTVTAP